VHSPRTGRQGQRGALGDRRPVMAPCCGSGNYGRQSPSRDDIDAGDDSSFNGGVLPSDAPTHLAMTRQDDYVSRVVNYLTGFQTLFNPKVKIPVFS
jgi:hypothetical protein